ncbi:hypothetical protein [Mucilaginibacter myungsuensis]|uniref:Uncharacterized protein n=1 Tax=Mucilaginibacter myungsuensis TaxID=649104 RepID=A0A929KY79_9SPHI|nr:hypothetical protein [Mucilaginibacter myungsuensis]MBE9661079.1 hypothetical protein [Mucilaginibacter myungsuensis]MDN3597223.1 hypothetical protein [Mucilaginibacter myungsuensis]
MSKDQISRGNAGVKKSQLQKLVNNYYDVIKKKDANGKIVDLDRKKDARSAWFSKEVIDQMFAAHGCTAENSKEFGLRLYFGVHKKGVLERNGEDVPEKYHNQQTIVLVPTRLKDGVPDADLLKDDTHAFAGADGKGDGNAEGEGDGVNHSKLCPPETGCGSLID